MRKIGDRPRFFSRSRKQAARNADQLISNILEIAGEKTWSVPYFRGLRRNCQMINGATYLYVLLKLVCWQLLQFLIV